LHLLDTKMSTIQIIILVIGCLFSIIGIFFIYKRIGVGESNINIAFLGKIKTRSTGLILVFIGAVLIYYSIVNDTYKIKKDDKKDNKTISVDTNKKGDEFKQIGDGNIQINHGKDIQININHRNDSINKLHNKKDNK